MVFHRDCDVNNNVVAPNIYEKIWEFWYYYIENLRQADGKVNWRFVKREMLESYDSSSSTSVYDMHGKSSVYCY